MRTLKFRLHDKEGVIVGYETHEVNKFGVIQIYHQSLRGDFDHDDKRLVREGYFIPCFYKHQFTGKLDCEGTEIFEGDKLEFDKEEWGGENNIHVVEWDEANAEWSWGGGCTSDMQFRKVVGHIYDKES